MALCLLVCGIFITLFSCQTKFKSIEKVVNLVEVDLYWTCYTNTDCSISGAVLLRALSPPFDGTPWKLSGVQESCCPLLTNASFIRRKYNKEHHVFAH